jgi:hypothetical protein
MPATLTASWRVADHSYSAGRCLSSAGRVDVVDEAFEQICAFVLAVVLSVIAH